MVISLTQGLAFTLTWAALLFLSFILMKAISFRWTAPVPFQHPLLFWLSPVSTASTWKSVEQGVYQAKIKIHLGLIFSLLLAFYYALFFFLDKTIASPILVGYLGGPILYLWFHALTLVFWIVGKASGCWIPPLLDRVFYSRSLSEFWAYRWNTFINQWFREGSLRYRRRYPGLTLWVVFLISGVWHELLVNLPFFWIMGHSFLGSMILYFQIEWAGIVLQRLYPRALRKRWFTWLWIYLPCPLVFNSATLRGLWLIH